MTRKTEYTDSLQSVRSKLKTQTRRIVMNYTPEEISVSNQGFEYINDSVKTQLCNLNSDDVTVVNVIFEKGGEIKRHHHENVEKIFVIDGSIKDLVSNKTFNEGKTFFIKGGQVHHIISDYALLTVTWKPPFPSG